MPSTEDLLTFADLVELGRTHAKTEWKRVGGKLDACNGAELLGAGLSHSEQCCLRYGYREQLHTLNCRAELARRPAPTSAALERRVDGATVLVLELEQQLAPRAPGERFFAERRRS